MEKNKKENDMFMRNYTMSDDAFANIVAQEVKNKANPKQVDFLREPNNIQRWLSCLDALVENLDEQLQEVDASLSSEERRYSDVGEEAFELIKEARIYYGTRKRKIEKFRFHVVRKIEEVSDLKRMYESGYGDIDREAMFLMYKKAITLHEEYFRKYDIEPTPADEALWATAQGRWEFEDVKGPEEIASSE